MSSYLMLLSIGPVQSFIAQARKAQDLWAGSYFLSYLINQAKQALPDDTELIFPAKNTHLDSVVASMPNRLLFITSDPETTGKILETEIRQVFENIITFALKKYESFGAFNQITIDSFKDFTEIFYAAVEYSDKDTYNEKYAKLESLVGAIKNNRSFEQIAYSEEKTYPIVICPVCGERHALALNGKLDYEHVKKLWTRISARNAKIKTNEYLCPVCLAKRLFPDYLENQTKNPKISFPSLADLTVSEWRMKMVHNNKLTSLENRLQNNEFLKRDKGFVHPKLKAEVLIHNLDIPETLTDAHWYFPENFTKSEFEKITDFDKDKFQDFQKSKPLKMPDTSYYGMMMMDGDGMGEMLAKVKNKHEHSSFSSVLADFAGKDVPKIIEEEHFGKLIYAGGDDVFAISSKNDLLSIMNSVRKSFKKTLSENQEAYTSVQGQFHMSAGAVIAHYKAPLFFVLDKVRQMEKIAKSFMIDETHKKNACALIMIAHSGNHKAVVFPWEYTDSQNNIYESVELLQQLQYFLKQEHLSKSFIYKLKDEFEPLLDKDGFLKSKTTGVFTSEFYRLIQRAIMNKKEKNKINDLADKLLCFFEYALSLNIEKYLAFLEAANVLNRSNI